MKFLLLITFSLSALAMHVDNDKALLYQPLFAKNAQELADKVETKRIEVVEENIIFPFGRARDRMMEAIEMVRVIVNSDEFKEMVIGYMNENGQRSYTRNEGMSNEDIYKFLMEGREVLDQDTPGEMNLYIKRYRPWWPWSKVIGYTKIGKSKYMYVNWRKYKYFDSVEMAGNIVHEWIHLMGFRHDSARDHDSVPYAVGYIIGKLANKYLDQGYLN
jgi:hypothetical protein